ncbi:uncharacterized protein SCHCODRAFT_02218413 [Schizophyllum commune H4-8]|uniref:uncharacterized protein n=1 Tax=Schizophyllum commune (strain H4-8 / FGSC 9210) TaxID=578458 RepID=UPI00215EA9C1|nr:uncharacterized protein SCHCODRAFT_02218413 [Schizophyllum commune H4-8]KAI5894890.1 hypothetical protein SCHCODRAFT_02218413 [Schizophyllum commune H4-8]
MSSPLVIAGGGKVGVPGAFGSRLVSVLGSQRAEETDEKACRQRERVEKELFVEEKAQGDTIWRQTAKIDCSLRGSFFKVPAFLYGWCRAAVKLQWYRSSPPRGRSHRQGLTPPFRPHNVRTCPWMMRLPRCIKCSTAAGIRVTLDGIASICIPVFDRHR